jgi:predicted lipid-binding transport protein (Tim44 family)
MKKNLIILLVGLLLAGAAFALNSFNSKSSTPTPADQTSASSESTAPSTSGSTMSSTAPKTTTTKPKIAGGGGDDESAGEAGESGNDD